MIYNVLSISALQQRDPVIHIYILFLTLSSIIMMRYSFLCSTAGPRCYSKCYRLHPLTPNSQPIPLRGSCWFSSSATSSGLLSLPGRLQPSSLSQTEPLNPLPWFPHVPHPCSIVYDFASARLCKASLRLLASVILSFFPPPSFLGPGSQQALRMCILAHFLQVFYPIACLWRQMTAS